MMKEAGTWSGLDGLGDRDDLGRLGSFDSFATQAPWDQGAMLDEQPMIESEPQQPSSEEFSLEEPCLENVEALFESLVDLDMPLVEVQALLGETPDPLVPPNQPGMRGMLPGLAAAAEAPPTQQQADTLHQPGDGLCSSCESLGAEARVFAEACRAGKKTEDKQLASEYVLDVSWGRLFGAAPTRAEWSLSL